MSTKKWTEENTKALVEAVGAPSGAVTADQVREIATQMEVSDRSISAKLRKLGYEVASLAKEKTSAFTAEDTAALVQFLDLNPGAFNYGEIAEQFKGGEFTPKQIQGKILALEKTALVKASEKVEAVRKYTPEEEATFIELANAGAYIEDIAKELNREVSSIRGKALALLTKNLIDNIPVQRDSKAKVEADPIEALGTDIATMTVTEIATATGKTERGIKTTLTRRGIKVADYDGAKKQEKARGKAEAETE